MLLPPNLIPSDLSGNFSSYDEVLGTAARSFAAIRAALVCQTVNNPMVWIPAERDRGALSAEGLEQFILLDNLTLVQAPSHREALWSAEQALRSGALKLVVLEILEPYTLTQSRRLKLALEASQSPTSLITILPAAGLHMNSAAHTRWQVEPFSAQNSPHTPNEQSPTFLQHWNLIKNKSGTLKSWTIDRNAADNFTDAKDKT